MALLLNDGKYIKISFTLIREFDDTNVIYFDIYKNKEERDLEKTEGIISVNKLEDNIFGNILNSKPEGETISESLIISAYKTLKSQEKFINAIDC